VHLQGLHLRVETDADSSSGLVRNARVQSESLPELPPPAWRPPPPPNLRRPARCSPLCYSLALTHSASPPHSLAARGRASRHRLTGVPRSSALSVVESQSSPS
jgi:hypothetical protein